MTRFADKPAACAGCVAETLGLGYVPADGPASAKIAFIGQGPGLEEASAAEPRPFIGPSGRRLFQSWAAQAGIPRSEAYVDNIVRCFLIRRNDDSSPMLRNGRYIDRPPTKREQTECWKRHVGAPLTALATAREAEGNRLVLVAVGMPSANFFAKREVSVNVAGTFEEVELAACV